MKIQESGENYLEMILMLKNEKGSVRSIDVAHALSVTKPSVSRAMSILRRFARAGYRPKRENIAFLSRGVSPSKT